jgi:hypothetical protein
MASSSPSTPATSPATDDDDDDDDAAFAARVRDACARHGVTLTPYTPEDEAFVRSKAAGGKKLDVRVRILGVAARHARTNAPSVLLCYPLRARRRCVESDDWSI